MESIEFKTLYSQDAQKFFSELANLRITVFREYPYLYEGSLDYEREYLDTYFKSKRSMVVLAIDSEKIDSGKIVGATTCVPLEDEEDEFKKPFQEHRLSVEKILYFGESVLLPDYRGRGIGKEFIRRREQEAKRLGLSQCVFCAVVRKVDDSRQPPSYQSPEGLWRKSGYAPLEGFTTTYRWKEIGEVSESPKLMQFWSKSF